MRIQITGSREFTDARLIEAAIVEAMSDSPDWPRRTPVVVHGGARGADRLAGGVAIRRQLTQEVHPADWDRYGKSAGYRRNAEMVELGADVCLAFFKRGAANVGTQMMVDLCKRAGIPVKEYWEEA